MIEIVNIRINFESQFMWVDFMEDGELKEVCLWETQPEDGVAQPPDGMIWQNPGNYHEFKGQSWNALNGIEQTVRAFIEGLSR